METIAIIILFFIASYLFYKIWMLKKEIRDKTFLFWEQEGDYKILKNSKGEEITRI